MKVPINPKVVARNDFRMLTLIACHYNNGEYGWEDREGNQFLQELQRLIGGRLCSR